MKTRAVNTKGQGSEIFLGYYKHDPPATFIEKIRKLEPKIIEILGLGQMLNVLWDESTLVS